MRPTHWPRLDHVHVVGITEILDAGDGIGPAIVMPYAAGGSLADVLATGRRLAPGELVAVAAPVAEALAAAHASGLVHGDVKPGNVLLTSAGQPLLADFGGDPSEGTDGYLAPERGSGAAADGPSDIYALGVLCRRALDADGHDAGRAAGLLAVIDRATHPDPGARFLHAEDLARALRNAVSPDEVHPPRPAGPGGRAMVGGETRRFGPRPPATGPSGRRARRRVSGRATVALLALMAAVGCRPAARIRARASTGGGLPGTRRRRLGPSIGRGDRGLGDTDGDGCIDHGYWFADPSRSGAWLLAVPTAHRARAMTYAVGRDGDVPVVGDWDCDGTATLALYRRASGEVFRYDTWPGDGPLVAVGRPGYPIGGTPRVEADRGCDRLVIDASAKPYRPTVTPWASSGS